METIRLATDSDWITTIWLDVPAKGVNTISPRVLAELAVALDQVERERTQGVIFASGKNHSFIAGADLFEISKMPPEQVIEFLAQGQQLFSRIAGLRMPTAAAINGDCLGGGLELALACTVRVAASDTSISIGLPETKLGILPGWGGTVRLPRRIGLTRALPLMLAGKTIPPKKALRAGIVDEIVRPEALLAAAKRLVSKSEPQHHFSLLDRVATVTPPVRKRIFRQAREETNHTTHGHYPAPMRLIDVVECGFRRGEQAGFDAERQALAELMQTETCQNLIRLFFLRQGAKRWIADSVKGQPAQVKRAAVVGGGTMGAGIAHALARAGIEVRLIEVDVKAMSAGLARIKKLLDDDLAAGRIDKVAARDAMNRIAPSIDWTGLHLVDFVIEAVAEEMTIKQQVFSRLDALTRPDAVLATNTSSLSVSEMAAMTVHPQRIVGLHFFNPVAKMPLVEVVRAKESSNEALATAAALAGRLGKTPILVADAPGFLVNRVLIPYLAEALAMAGEGTPIDQIDAALTEWGMPMGPFELLDTIGLDVAAHVLTTLGGVLREPPPIPAAIGTALARHWLGVKSGRGFYLHDAHGKRGKAKLVINAEMQQLFNQHGVNQNNEQIVDRLILPMVNEAARVLEEGVTASADAIDLATVLGLGFAPFRGGLARYADAVGLRNIVARLEQLRGQFGPRFSPASLLAELAAADSPLTDWRPTPVDEERTKRGYFHADVQTR
jgi:3-hydroxyacyl-CoA dehydrogenase/enoyl-CoA hydratase/3-hydroxybutyryl-CoA epimerase